MFANGPAALAEAADDLGRFAEESSASRMRSPATARSIGSSSGSYPTSGGSQPCSAPVTRPSSLAPAQAGELSPELVVLGAEALPGLDVHGGAGEQGAELGGGAAKHRRQLCGCPAEGDEGLEATRPTPGAARPMSVSSASQATAVSRSSPLATPRAPW